MSKLVRIDDTTEEGKALLVLVKSSNYARIEEEDTDIPKWQQDEVLKRIANAKPSDYKKWDDIERQIRFGE